MMDRWLPRKPKRKVIQAPRNWGVRRKMEYRKNEKGKKNAKYRTSTNHPHKNKKRRGGLKKRRRRRVACWITLFHCLETIVQRDAACTIVEPTRGDGQRAWGMGLLWQPKRRTRDVKPQRGLGRGERGERRRGKSLCASAATVFSD